jgi:Tfp pilus assembly protein FimT
VKEKISGMFVRKSVRGFSFLELVIVLMILFIIGGIAFMSIRDAMRNQRAESALQDVLNVTRTARQLAIDRRRVFKVSYAKSPGLMTVTVTEPGNSSAGCAAATAQWPDSPAPIPPPTPVLGNFDFAWISGAPNSDTTAPDGFTAGDATKPIIFTSKKDPDSICFYPDGSGRDEDNNFSSGIVYLAPSATSETNATTRMTYMRAVTVFGPTGRISGWRLSQTKSGLQWKMW